MAFICWEKPCELRGLPVLQPHQPGERNGRFWEIRAFSSSSGRFGPWAHPSCARRRSTNPRDPRVTRTVIVLLICSECKHRCGSAPAAAAPRFHSVILEVLFPCPLRTVSVARRTLADVRVGRLHPGFQSRFLRSCWPSRWPPCWLPARNCGCRASNCRSRYLCSAPVIALVFSADPAAGLPQIASSTSSSSCWWSSPLCATSRWSDGCS